MISCIYIIVCIKYPGKYYVGSTIDYLYRKERHLVDFRKNKHHGKYLPRIFKKWGEKYFRFYILEEVKDISKLLDREDYYLQDWFWFDDERDCNFS